MAHTQTKSSSIDGHAEKFRTPLDLSLADRPAPFFARHPWVGYLIFIICALIFAWLTWLVMAKSPLIGWDLPVSKAIHEWATHQSPAVGLVMRFFSAYGRDGVALIAVILAVAWIRRRARRELWMLFFGVLGTELLFQALSNIIDRARPEFKDPFETLIGAGYPSGHAATNVLLGWMILYLLLPRIQSNGKRALLILAVVGVVAMVIISRLFLGLHFPTDMIGGVVLGLGWGGLIFAVTDSHFFPLIKK